MLSNSVCIKSVTFDHIIQNEERARFVVQLYTAATQTKQKCHNVFGVHFIVTVFENKCISYFQITIHYNRECRRGKEVENVCLFSFKSSKKNLRALVVENISLVAIFKDLCNGDLTADDKICQLGNRISISSREHSALRWRLLNHQH